MASKVTTTKFIDYEDRNDGVLVANYRKNVDKIGLADAEVILQERLAFQNGKLRRLVLITPPPSVELSLAAQQFLGSAQGQQGISAIAMISGSQAERVQEFLDSKVEKTGILIRAFVTEEEGIEWISELN